MYFIKKENTGQATPDFLSTDPDSGSCDHYPLAAFLVKHEFQLSRVEPPTSQADVVSSTPIVRALPVVLTQFVIQA